MDTVGGNLKCGSKILIPVNIVDKVKVGQN